MKIKICKHFPKMPKGNALGVQKFHKKLTNAFPNDTIIIKSCINICKTCKKLPAVNADGIKMKGKSIEKVINKIEKL